MGYSTDFFGSFELDKQLTPEHAAYLQAFNNTRRMKRNAELTAARPDPIREAVGLPIGVDGEFFVGAASDNCGQEHSPDVIEYNYPPSTQPGAVVSMATVCRWIVD